MQSPPPTVELARIGTVIQALARPIEFVKKLLSPLATEDQQKFSIKGLQEIRHKAGHLDNSEMDGGWVNNDTSNLPRRSSRGTSRESGDDKGSNFANPPYDAG